MRLNDYMTEAYERDPEDQKDMEDQFKRSATEFRKALKGADGKLKKFEQLIKSGKVDVSKGILALSDAKRAMWEVDKALKK